MSTCAGDSASDGAAVFAAPLCARDIVQRQRQGVNDPGVAPHKPPRRGPGVVHAPLSSSVSPAVVDAVWRRESALDARANVPAHSEVDYAVDLMVILRCTRKLLVRLKHTGDVRPAESTMKLGDWYGNILRIGRRQMLLFISERSRLPVVFPIREAKHLEVVFPAAVYDALAAVGIGAKDIVDERSKMSEIAFGRTNNRSLLGTLNDFAFMAQQGNANRAEPESSEELMRFLAQTPILPLDGASPIELARAAFARGSKR